MLMFFSWIRKFFNIGVVGVLKKSAQMKDRFYENGRFSIKQ
jgi:hypothetical protein